LAKGRRLSDCVPLRVDFGLADSAGRTFEGELATKGTKKHKRNSKHLGFLLRFFVPFAANSPFPASNYT
jgi:hypothetical protein